MDRNRVYRIKRELEKIRDEMRCKKRGVDKIE
jgi:hypothetical protein